MHELRAVHGSGTSDRRKGFARPTPILAAPPRCQPSPCGGLRVNPATSERVGVASARTPLIRSGRSVIQSVGPTDHCTRAMVPWPCRYPGSRGSRVSLDRERATHVVVLFIAGHLLALRFWYHFRYQSAFAGLSRDFKTKINQAKRSTSTQRACVHAR